MHHRYSHISRNLIIGALLLILCGCSHKPEKRPADMGDYGSAEEVLALDNKTNISNDAPVVTAVSIAVTDTTNNIYLVDPKTLKIHSYTHNMVYRWSAGGKGSGPGLFSSISALYVTGQCFYAYDFANAIMSMYSLNGQLISEWAYGKSGIQINHIRRMPDKKYIATGWDERSETLVHIYSDDFKKRLVSFVKGSDVFKTKYPELEKQVVRNYPGYVSPINDSTIVYAPAAYSGELLRYQKLSGSTWKLTGTVEGYTQIKKPVHFHLSSIGSSGRSFLSGFNPKGGYFHTAFTSMSWGLYELNNGEFAHLSIRMNKNDHWNLVVEYFDSTNLKLKNFTIIKDLIPSQKPEKLPIWMDREGQIYMDQNSDQPLSILEVHKK